MIDNANFYAALSIVRRMLCVTPGLWQLAPLSASNLHQRAKELKIDFSDVPSIKALWHSGLLRADIVSSETELNIDGLEFVSRESGRFVYCDQRRITRTPAGLGGVLANREVSDSCELLFHPFRIYLLYHVDRVFDLRVSNTQYLSYPDGLTGLIQFQRDHWDRWTAQEASAERLEHWNRVAELAITLEPFGYPAALEGVGWRSVLHAAPTHSQWQQYRDEVVSLLRSADTGQLDSVREELCVNAEMLDGEKLLHVLLRLMAERRESRHRGPLGTCMQFLTMAEVIRRATEETTGQNLREEDELGFGQWMDGARDSIYGTSRILDADPRTRRDFVLAMGLDVGVKTRCYVEGETELGAFSSAVGEAAGIEFINLHGQVVERGGRGLAFSASLENDKKSQVFSVVVLDADRQDSIRVLRRAAESEKFFGRFFISDPDIEFGNFTLTELVDVALTVLREKEAETPAREKMLDALTAVRTGDEFFSALRRQFSIRAVDKGEEWGAALMTYARGNRTFPPGHPCAGATRPLVSAALFLVNTRRVGYNTTVRNYVMDSTTGELLKRPDTIPDP